MCCKILVTKLFWNKEWNIWFKLDHINWSNCFKNQVLEYNFFVSFTYISLDVLFDYVVDVCGRSLNIWSVNIHSIFLIFENDHNCLYKYLLHSIFLIFGNDHNCLYKCLLHSVFLILENNYSFIIWFGNQWNTICWIKNCWKCQIMHIRKQP